MHQHIALLELSEHLGAGNSSPEHHALTHAELACNCFQSFPLWTISHNPVFALRNSRVKTREGSQAEFKTFQVQQISQAYDAERTAAVNGQRSEQVEILLRQPCLRVDDHVAAAERCQSLCSVIGCRKRDGSSPRGQAEEGVPLADSLSDRTQDLVGFAPRTEEAPEARGWGFAAADGSPNKWYRQKHQEAWHPVVDEGHVVHLVKSD